MEIVNNKILHNSNKEIEHNSDLYLSVKNEVFVVNTNFIRRHLEFNNVESLCRDIYTFDKFETDKNYGLILNREILNNYIEYDRGIQAKKVEERRLAKVVMENVSGLVDFFNMKYKPLSEDYRFEFSDGREDYYLCRITFYSMYDELYFFIKKDKIDCCTKEVNYVRKLHRSFARFTNLYSSQIDTSLSDNYENIKNFIWDCVARYLRHKKY